MPLVRSARIVSFATVSFFLASWASATVFVTTRLDDAPVDGCATNGCTLREAVIAANGAGGPHRVELGVRGRYELTIAGMGEDAAATGDLDLLVSMEVGPPLGIAPDAAAYVVDANGIDRVFHTQAPGGSAILLRGMTITGGSAALALNDRGGGLLADSPGGSESNVIVEDCVVGANQANLGGGIAVIDTALTVLRSAIQGNHAVTVGGSGYGGGIHVSSTGAGPIFPGSARLLGTTVTGNDASGFAGGLVFATAPVTIEHTTIAGNSAPQGSVLMAFIAEKLTSRNSILAGDCYFLDPTTPQSGGGNVESPGNSCRLGPADQVGISGAALGLGALTLQGGATPTMALAATSPARNRVPAARCAPFDERGFQRLAPGDAACDAGAYEQMELCRTPNLAVPDVDLAGVDDTLSVTANFPLHDLDLYARVDHTWVGDLKLRLTRTGAFPVSALLVDVPGGPAFPGGCSDENLRLRLDDEAGASVESACSNTGVAGVEAFPVSAARPGDPPASLLASFEGVPVAGTWTLNVADVSPIDTGTLVEWCLLPNGGLFSDGFESANLNAWSATVPPGSPQLVNPSFDLGHTVWAENSTFFPGELLTLQGVGGAPAAHTSPWLAWLGGAASEVSDLSQLVAVPPGSGPAYLHFYYQIASDETNCNQVTPSDTASLRVNDVQVDSLVLCNAFNTGANWTEFSFLQDFSAYAGQTVAVTIRTSNNATLVSSFYLDSLSWSSAP